MTCTDWLVIILLGTNVAGWTLALVWWKMAAFWRWNSDRGWNHFADAMDCLREQRNVMEEMEERDSGDEWKEAE